MGTYTVTLSVTDDDGAVGSDTLTIYVLPTNMDWVNQYGSKGIYSKDYSYDIDSNGNIYVAGRTSGLLDGYQSDIYDDAFIGKFDLQGNIIWTRQFGGFRDASGTGVHVSSDAVYVVGRTEGVLAGLINYGEHDAFVRKYDFNGNELWTRQFGGSAFDTATAVIGDSSGVYITGITEGTIIGQTSAGGSDIFVRKYDHNGNELWTNQIGNTVPTYGEDDISNDIAVSSAGAFVTGTTEGALPGQSSSGDKNAFIIGYDTNGNILWINQFGDPGLPSLGQGIYIYSDFIYLTGSMWVPDRLGGNAFIRKYDINGNMVWSHLFGTVSYHTIFANEVAVDSSGIYITGSTSGRLPGQSRLPGSHRDGFVRKYYHNGNIAWTHQFGSFRLDDPSYGSFDYAFGICIDSTGVYITGVTEGVFPGQASFGYTDAFIIKYDINGNTLWTNQFGGYWPRRDEAHDIYYDGNLYVTGYVQGYLPNQPIDSPSAFITKHDSNGNLLWTKQFGVPFNHCVTGISGDASAIYITGFTTGTIPGQIKWGRKDGFLYKFDFNGNEQWARQFGSSEDDFPNEIYVDSTGIYVVGTTNGIMENQIGGKDAFITKYDHNGVHQWTRQFGTIGLDEAQNIVSEGTYLYAVGYTRDAFAGQTNQGEEDIFICKYDINGNSIWNEQIGGPAKDFAFGATVDSSGIYISGYTTGNLPGHTNYGETDIIIIKYDFDGKVVWTQQVGTSDKDYSTSITTDSSGVYLGGSTWGAFSGNTNQGAGDSLIQKYDVNGNLAWTQQFGLKESDTVKCITVGDPGQIFIAGGVKTNFPGHIYLGGPDFYVSRFSFITPTGDNVQVQPTEDLSITFTEIAESGYTSATMSTENPGPDKTGFKFLGTYYEITTTATFNGLITISIEYDESSIPSGHEDRIALLHWDGSHWTEITTSIDFDNNIIYGVTDSFSCFAVAFEVLSIQIDIKPGSDPNSINLGAAGTIPVAILSSSEFHATTIDPSTVTLSGASVGLKGKGSRYMASSEDVNGDGLTDLIIHVEIFELNLVEGSSNSVLYGYSYDGTVVIQGIDSINVVPP
jgi:hypothetical protein